MRQNHILGEVIRTKVRRERPTSKLTIESSFLKLVGQVIENVVYVTNLRTPREIILTRWQAQSLRDQRQVVFNPNLSLRSILHLNLIHLTVAGMIQRNNCVCPFALRARDPIMHLGFVSVQAELQNCSVVAVTPHHR